jgi:ribosomal-protein-alanine N-acetyltransferase
MKCEFPKLETPRLLLRAIHLSDTPSVRHNLCAPETVQYSDSAEVPSLEEVGKIIETWQERFKLQQGIRWGITRKGEDTVIGSCGYKNWVKKHYRAEIGYDISGEYRRQELMTEVLDAVIRFGFEVMELNRIQAIVVSNNLPSVKLLSKLGFSEEGVLREYEFHREQFADLRLFSLLRREFRKEWY